MFMVACSTRFTQKHVCLFETAGNNDAAEYVEGAKGSPNHMEKQVRLVLEEGFTTNAQHSKIRMLSSMLVWML